MKKHTAYIAISLSIAIFIIVGVILYYYFSFLKTKDYAILTPEFNKNNASAIDPISSAKGQAKIDSLEAALVKYDPSHSAITDLEISEFVSDQNIDRIDKINYLLRLLEKFKFDQEKSTYIVGFLVNLRPVEKYGVLIDLARNKNNSQELRLIVVKTLNDLLAADTAKLVSDKSIMYSASNDIKAALRSLLSGDDNSVMKKEIASALISISPYEDMANILSATGNDGKELFSKFETVVMNIDSSLLSSDRTPDKLSSSLSEMSQLSDQEKGLAIIRISELVKVAEINSAEALVIKNKLIENEPKIAGSTGYNGIEVADYGAWADSIAKLNSFGGSDDDKYRYLHQMLISEKDYYKQIAIIGGIDDGIILYLRKTNQALSVANSISSNKPKDVNQDWLDLNDDIILQLSRKN